MNAMQKFRKEAEANFSNYGGDYIGVPNYIGVPQYDNANGGKTQVGNVSLPDIDSRDRTLSYNIVNGNSSTSLSAIMWAAYAGTSQTSGITVNLAESSVTQFNNEVSSNPVLIYGLKYTCGTASQFNNAWSFTQSSSAGLNQTWSVQPISWRSAQNSIGTQIDAPTWLLQVDGGLSLSIPTNASESLLLYFTIKTRGNLANILKGNAVLNIAPHAAPTGIPQLDLPEHRQL